MKIREFPVMMNYKATVEELIGGGNLGVGWGEKMLNSKNFPAIMPKERDVRYLQEKSIYLINFGKATGTDKAMEDLREIHLISGMGLKPAGIFDVLALNRTYPASPGMKKEYSLGGLAIVALGSLLKREGADSFWAPVLTCDDEFENPFERRRTIHLNSTEYFDERRGKIVKFDDFWPKHCSFAAVLE